MWFLLTSALATCPDPVQTLDRAEEQLLQYELDAAQASLDLVVQGLACGEPASAEVHRRYWLTRGLLWAYQEDPRKTEAFAASKLRASSWNPSFGPETEDPPDAPPSVYNQWRVAAAPSATFALELAPLPSTAELWVDGLPAEPGSISGGAHLVQVGDHAGMFHAVPLLVRGDVTVTLPERAEPEVVEPEPVEPEPAVEPEPEPAVEPEPEPAVVEADVEPAEEPAVADADEVEADEAETDEAEPLVLATESAITAQALTLPQTRRQKPQKVRRGHASRGLLVSGLVLGTVGAGALGVAALTKTAYRVDGTDDDGLYYTNLGAGIGGYGLVGVGTLMVGTSFVVNRW